jgi:hypothetical protein
MQDRYFGDVGDFGKFGLLRLLCGSGESELRLGIVWYLFPDESHNQDGKHVAYLQEARNRFRDCDVPLYDGLRSLLVDAQGQIIQAHRRISTIESSGLLPNDTAFFSDPLSYPSGLSISQRRSLRERWFSAALARTASADLIFLDPDNGIECASVSSTGLKGPKYCYLEEIASFIERDQSLVIYHHLNRSAPHPKQNQEMITRLYEKLNLVAKGFEATALIFSRGSSRAYFILTAHRHKEILGKRLMDLRSLAWSQHFTPFQPEYA